MIVNEGIKPCGHVEGIIEYKSGETTKIEFPNTVLTTGRAALAACLAHSIGDSFQFYVHRMLFGDGGTADGATKFVASGRNGLFGISRGSKPVIATVDPNIITQVIFTSVLPFVDDTNGYTLNEMALRLATGDLYSMVTFPDLTKTDQMQITWNWRLSFV